MSFPSFASLTMGLPFIHGLTPMVFGQEIITKIDFFKKFQFHKKAKLHFDNFRHQVVTRVWNLAKRLDQSHSKHENKKIIHKKES